MDTRTAALPAMVARSRGLYTRQLGALLHRRGQSCIRRCSGCRTGARNATDVAVGPSVRQSVREPPGTFLGALLRLRDYRGCGPGVSGAPGRLQTPTSSLARCYRSRQTVDVCEVSQGRLNDVRPSAADAAGWPALGRSQSSPRGPAGLGSSRSGTGKASAQRGRRWSM